MVSSAVAPLEQKQQEQQQQPALMLPARTGASRRQRRLRLQQMREPHQAQPNQKYLSTQNWPQLRRQRQQQPQYQEEPMDKLPLSQLPCDIEVLESTMAEMRLQSLPSLQGVWKAKMQGQVMSQCPTADTLAPSSICVRTASSSDKATESSDCASEVSDVGAPNSMPSMVFPPTPESTPSNSPRYHNAGNIEPYNCGTMAFAFGLPFEQEQMMVVANYDAWQPQGVGGQPFSDAECEAMLRQLESGDACVRSVITSVTQVAWPLVSCATGSRVVQRVLDMATDAEQIAVADKLQGQVLEAVMCPHANHVLQKSIGLLPPERLQFILDEMSGHVAAAARHRYGCRVLERLIERASQTELLVAEVLANASTLSRHPFGNFVVQHVLKFGTPPQRHNVIDVLVSDIQRLARHRVASHVVRCALKHSSAEDKQALVVALSADADDLADLAHHHCGSYVVKQIRREMQR